MLAPLSWVRDFTPIEAPTEEIVAALDQLGLEVEGVEDSGREVAGVRVARILEVVPHPNADRLTLVDVDFGDGTSRVVCGASNVTPGMVVPFAPAGARLSHGLTLERRKIRGVVSDGMLCSARELGLSSDHEGIVALDPASEVGADLRDVLGLDDVVFDLAITPNRSDAMCIVGVARELAAHFGIPFEVPEPRSPVEKHVDVEPSVEIEAPDRCPRYLARVAAVEIGPSPAWLTQRLVKAGVRPINNVVDVTNYVLVERNQPLHAFDLDRLAGPGIVVRLAAAGERITTLDGVDRGLTADEDLLICDADRTGQALAGIMGGSTSEISDATTSLLLEAAYFEPMGIARTSKRLKLRSESSARFERGIDPDAVATSAERAMELLVEVAGARVAQTVVDEQPLPTERAAIRVRPARVNAVLGTSLDDAQIVDALQPLGIDVAPTDGEETFETIPPTWRPDLTREIDMIEEVARRVGFDRIGRTVPDTGGQVGALTRAQRERRAVADALVGFGLSEAITLPLVAPGDLERVGAPTERLVSVTNPLRAEESVLRTRIFPGLLRAVVANRAHGIDDVALFEMGRVFLAPSARSGSMPEEPEHVAIVLAGLVRRDPVEKDRPVDLHDATEIVHLVGDTLELAALGIEPAIVPGLETGAAAEVFVDEARIGMFGALDRETLESIGLEAPVVVAELDLGTLLAGRRRDRRFRTPSRFPASSIDLAFVVDVGVTAKAVLDVLRSTGGELLEAAWCFDEFRSPTLGDRRSLAFGLRFRAPDRTLTDVEVAALREAAIAAVRESLGASLRA